MSQTLLEKHENLVIEMANIFLDNMEQELGKKYKDYKHNVNGSLSEGQFTILKKKYDISDREFADLYTEFQNMKPTAHLKSTMEAFTASGGNVDIEPEYDESAQRVKVDIKFAIKDKSLDKLEGLSTIEGIILKMNAMIQLDSALSGSDPDGRPAF